MVSWAWLLVLFAPFWSSSADTISIVTWNFRPIAPVAGVTNTQTGVIEAAAHTLQKIEPDVILLQGMQDWQMCSDLAQALKPADYNVVICSSLRRSASADADALEVGILAKQKAYFSWSEPWHSPEGVKVSGGYAFAALVIGERRIGFFSTDITQPHLPALCAQQLLDQIDAVRHWETNQAQTYLLGCTFNSSSNSAPPMRDKLFQFLGTGGLEDAFKYQPLARKSTVRRTSGAPRWIADFILLDQTAFSSQVDVLTNSFSGHFPVVCKVETDPARVATARAAQAELAGTTEPPAVSETQTTVAAQRTSPAALARFNISETARLVGAGAAVVMVLVLFGRLLMRRRPVRAMTPPARLPMSSEAEHRKAASSYTVVIAPHSTTASIADSTSPHSQPVIQIDGPPTQTQSVFWRQRALAAEEQARCAQELLRQGLVSQLSQWLKQKLVRKLIVDRAQLLEAQQEAARKALKVDERLNRIEQQIQKQNQSYERRIEELNRQLLAAKEESRELIRARIVQVRAEMEAARARLLAKAQEEP